MRTFSNRLKRVWISAHPKRDSRRKSLLKAFSRRVIGTLDTVLLSWMLTGALSIAVSIGGLELLTKTVLYYFHERVWATKEVKSYEELNQNTNI